MVEALLVYAVNLRGMMLMKKIRFIVFFILAFAFMKSVALAAVPAKPSTFSYAYDFAGNVLSEDDEKIIADYGEALFRTTSDQVIAVVVSSFDGMNAADYSTDLINKWGIGSADKNNGVVVLLSTGDREIRIGTGTGIDQVMSDGSAGLLIDDNLSLFANGNYSHGMTSLYKDVCNYLANVRGTSLSASVPTQQKTTPSVPEKPSMFSYAYDFSGTVFSEDDKEIIADYGEALFRTTGDQVIAVVVSSFDGMSAADYSTDLINKWGIGSADKDNGVVVLLSIGDREIRIGTGTGIDQVMSGGSAGLLIDDNLNYFASGNYSHGMTSLYKDVCNYLANVRGLSLSVPTQQKTTPSVPEKPSMFSYAYDFSGTVFSEDDKEIIADYGEALFRATGDQVIAVIVSSFDGMSAADYSTELINKWGIGSADNDNGVIVLLSISDREIRIGTGTGIEQVMSDGTVGLLIDDNLNYFATGNYSIGMIYLYKDVCKYLVYARGKEPLRISIDDTGNGQL